MSKQNIALLIVSNLLLLVGLSAHATPRMSLTAGTPCSGCHYSLNGGGGRTELGWSSMSKTGAFTYQQLGLKTLHEQESNLIADMVSIGVDFRVQSIRPDQPRLDEDTGKVTYQDVKWFPMQLQPYLAVKPTDDFVIYGSMLPGPGASKGDFSDHVYPGMSTFEYWASYSISPTLPTVRVGKFQPTFGIRHDDHTILQRGDAKTRPVPLIPPNFTELGLEVSHQPLRWLRAEVGVFNTTHLSAAFGQGLEEIEIAPYAISSRLTFLPHITLGGTSSEEDDFGDDDFGDDDEDDDFGDDDEDDDVDLPVNLNMWLGVSNYWSRDFNLINGFFGVGTNSGLSAVAEVGFRDNPNEGQKIYRQLNTLFGLNYALKEWIVFNARVERGQTQYLTTTLDEVSVAWQYVAGIEFFPIPYVEVRPEYRLIDTYDYRFGQATLQVHLFY